MTSTAAAASLDSWIAMGGYALFVWPAFAITFAVLAGLALLSTRTLRRRGRTLATLAAADRNRAPAGTAGPALPTVAGDA